MCSAGLQQGIELEPCVTQGCFPNKTNHNEIHYLRNSTQVLSAIDFILYDYRYKVEIAYLIATISQAFREPNLRPRVISDQKRKFFAIPPLRDPNV